MTALGINEAENAKITFAIGDVHGCCDKLRALHAACLAAADEKDASFILIGDYIDRGPDSAGVIDFLMALAIETPGRITCLRGNHEDMLLRAANPDRSDSDLMTWWGNGGEATLSSYGIDDPCDLPADHLAWIRTLPLQVQDRQRLFVHAGIRPGIAVSGQLEQDQLWIREPFLSSSDDHGPLIVHGHTPVRSRTPDLRDNRLNLDTGACFGGPLTAAAFSEDQRAPLFFLTNAGITPASDSIRDTGL